MNEKKIDSDKYKLYLNDEELSGEIYFPLFDKNLEVFSDVYQGFSNPTLEDAKEVALYLQRIDKNDKVYTDFVEGVSNSYNDYLTDEVNSNSLDWRAERTNLDLNISDEKIVKLLEPESIGIMKNHGEIAFSIFFTCPWEEEHGLGWLIYKDKTVVVACGISGITPWNDDLKSSNYAPLYSKKINSPYISAELEEKFYKHREDYKAGKIFKENDSFEINVKETQKRYNKNAFIIVVVSIVFIVLLLSGISIMIHRQGESELLEEFKNNFSLDYKVPSKFKFKDDDYQYIYDYRTDDTSCTIYISMRSIYKEDFDLLDEVNKETTRNEELEEKNINGYNWIVTHGENKTNYFAEFDGQEYEVNYYIYGDDNNYCSSNLDEFENSLNFHYIDKKIKVDIPSNYYSEITNSKVKKYSMKNGERTCSISLEEVKSEDDIVVSDVLKEDMDNNYGGISGEIAHKYINGYRWLYAVNDNYFLYYLNRDKILYKLVFNINNDYDETCNNDMDRVVKYGVDFIINNK